MTHDPQDLNSSAQPDRRVNLDKDAGPTAARPEDSWTQTGRQTPPFGERPGVSWASVNPDTSMAAPGDVATRRLVAGLLGVFLGSFGAHKFYIGAINAGIILLAINVGGWLLTLLLSVLTLGVGALILVPLMTVVSMVLGIVGLIEGVIYLTKSDADFQRDYLVGKKPWF